MKLNNLKTVFFGTSDFAVQILEAVKNNTDLLAVVSQPDRPSGRSQEMAASPVTNYAREAGLDLFQFESLKDSEVIDALKELGAEMFIVAAYGKIIPQSILDIPSKGTLNVHGSILPKYRGASPIHAALINGDEFTGNTIMVMDAQMDHGPVLQSSNVKIEAEDDFKSLESKMAADGAGLLIKTLSGYLDGEIVPKDQDHDHATYTKLITKENGLVDWRRSPEEIFNQWRAYRYWPGIYSYLPAANGRHTKIIFNKIKKAPSAGPHLPGTIIFKDGGFFIAVGDVSIEVLELTPEGKKTMTAKDFINGFSKLNGATLSSGPQLPA